MLATLVILLAVAAGEGPPPPPPPPAPGAGPLEKALAEAKEKDRPVLVDFFTDWCGYCKKMDREVFTDPAVAAFCNGNFILLRVDAEKGEGEALKTKYAVEGYPTFVLLGPDGTELERQVGFAPKEEFLPLLQEARAGITFASLPGRIEKSPGDGALRLSYGKRLMAREKVAEAKEQFEKAVALDPKDAMPVTVDARLQLALLAADEERSPGPLVAFAEKYAATPAAVGAHRVLLEHALGRQDQDGALVSFAFLHARGALIVRERCHYAFILATVKKDGEKALPIAEEAIRSAPDELYGPMAKAFALAALRRHDEAVEWGRKALAKAPPEMEEEGKNFVEQLEALRDAAKGGAVGKPAGEEEAPKEGEK